MALISKMPSPCRTHTHTSETKHHKKIKDPSGNTFSALFKAKCPLTCPLVNWLISVGRVLTKSADPCSEEKCLYMLTLPENPQYFFLLNRNNRIYTNSHFQAALGVSFVSRQLFLEWFCTWMGCSPFPWINESTIWPALPAPAQRLRCNSKMWGMLTQKTPFTSSLLLTEAALSLLGCFREEFGGKTKALKSKPSSNAPVCGPSRQFMQWEMGSH